MAGVLVLLGLEPDTIDGRIDLGQTQHVGDEARNHAATRGDVRQRIASGVGQFRLAADLDATLSRPRARADQYSYDLFGVVEEDLVPTSMLLQTILDAWL
jgi:hypothetical protein